MSLNTLNFALNNGVHIPSIGLGTYQTADFSTLTNTLQTALSLGYRHIDTAAFYKNEKMIGQVLQDLYKKQSDFSLSRSDLFITSKLWPTNFGYEKALSSFQSSLSQLQTDYLDLYLLHWPNPQNKETWKALEKLYKEGYIRAIGVSNFTVSQLEELLSYADVPPTVNQIECHPHLVDYDLLDFCKKHHIQVESWSPFMRGCIFKEPILLELAEKHHKTVAQIVLKWNLQLGLIPLPKSVTPNRLKENLELFDFTLSKEDMALIAKLNDGYRTGADPTEVYLHPEIVTG